MRCCPECGSTYYITNEGATIFRTYEDGKMISSDHDVNTELHVKCESCGHEWNPFDEKDWGHTGEKKFTQEKIDWKID